MAVDINIDKNKLPNHIGIIMDGNGRWAQKKLKPRIFGHKAGMKSLKEIIRASSDIGVNILTIYAFSTENWKRPKAEVEGLMNLLVEYFDKEIDELHENGVRINIIGQRQFLPDIVIDTVDSATKLTQNNKGLKLNIAINYGGRDEIIAGIKSLYYDIIDNNISIEAVDEEMFANYLFTKGMDYPDLIIRTSGEMRLSNFLVWQSAYSEFWFTDVLWPDFSKKDLFQAIYDYQKRQRKYGGLK